MTNIEKLKTKMQENIIVITDPMMIHYFTGNLYHPDERFVALCIEKDKAPYLIVNGLFPLPKGIEYKVYMDGQDPFELFETIHKGNLGVDGNMPSRYLLRFQELGFTVSNVSETLNQIRRVKSKEEIDIMRKASANNDEIMGKVRNFLKEGLTEIEIANFIIEQQSLAPQTGVSFTPISVFTENAADPHGITTNRQLKKGDVVLIDMGGMYEGYASDMTRCFFTGTHDKLEEIYKLVLKAQRAATNAVKIGVPLSDVDKAARDVISDGGYGEYFTHRTGHGIGMETHEPLDVSSANHTLIEEGMVFSIEPGIYLPGLGGIRLENLVAVTKDGASVLNEYPLEFQNIQVEL